MSQNIIGRRVMRACVGGCGYSIGPEILVCPTCWGRVPLELRKALWAARKHGGTAGRLLAARDVLDWARANLAPAKDQAKK